MTRLYFLIALLGIVVDSAAQNLVPNPSFESDTTVPICSWPIQNDPGTSLVDGWVSPTRATADYFNSDYSFIDLAPLLLARSGQGRAAIICGLGQQLPESRNYKEYIQCRLLQPLDAGKTYRINFYLALDRAVNYTAPGIGAYLSAQPVLSQSKERLLLPAQIRMKKLLSPSDGWVEVSGSYKAEGGEQYLTIGSFSDTSAIPLWKLGEPTWMGTASNHVRRGAYIYVDDVCVAEKTPQGCNCDIPLQPLAEQADQQAPDHYLFVLDVSKSMGDDKKLKALRNQIARFAERIHNTDRIAVMTFSEKPMLQIPFSSGYSADRMNRMLKRLKARGGTNGDQALLTAAKLLDSLHLYARLHLVFATDGMFTLSPNTESTVDSILHRTGCSLQILHMGLTENRDLLRLAQRQTQGRYEQTTPDLLSAIFDAEQPAQEPVPVKPLPVREQQYTNMRRALLRMPAEIMPVPGY